jgi:hypothetical protein
VLEPQSWFMVFNVGYGHFTSQTKNDYETTKYVFLRQQIWQRMDKVGEESHNPLLMHMQPFIQPNLYSQPPMSNIPERRH